VFTRVNFVDWVGLSPIATDWKPTMEAAFVDLLGGNTILGADISSLTTGKIR